MADNVAITAGSGTSIATDDVGGVHLQRVKLDVGADGASDPVVGSLPTRHTTSAAATATWTSATADETSLTLDVSSYASVGLVLAGDGGTCTQGLVLFEVSVNGTTDWVQVASPLAYSDWSVSATRSWSLTDLNGTSSPYPFTFGVGPYKGFRVRLTDVIVGTISVAVTAVASSAPGATEVIAKQDVNEPYNVIVQTLPNVTVGAALPAGDNNIGNVDIVTLPALPSGTNNIGDVDIASALPAGDNNIGNVDVVSLPALPTGTNNIGDVDVLSLPALPAGTNNIGDVDIASALPTGSNTIGAVNLAQYTPASGRLPVDGSGVTQPVSGTVAVSGSVAVTNAGTFAVQPAGTIAHDAADSGYPVKVGSRAINALGTAVANNDRTDNVSDTFGRQLTGHIDPAMQVHKFVSVTTQQTGTDVWTPAAGKRIAVTSVILGSFGTTAARVILWFGDNADTTFTVGTDQVLCAASFAPSATAKPGLVYTPGVNPVFCTTADRELHLTTDAGISLDITVEGYEW
jgi:hypothetical protein